MTKFSVDKGAVEARAARVLLNEAQALQKLAGELPVDFSAAVALILNSKGRVIVSGMGKSGHIGRKIAATLASTGTASFFVHPAEASHGDLGMVTPEDICLLISNSGETSELTDLIAHCTRFRIPIIAISKRPESTLMRAADFQLTLPDVPEACSIGMAPTTSTSLTLGLGDALAVVLMEERGFLPENFRTYHPGGKLGARLAVASQIMHKDLPLVKQTTPMFEVIIAMTSGGFGIAGVVNEQGELIGAISDGDLRRHMSNLMSKTAGELSKRKPITISPQSLVVEATTILSEHKIGALFVVDENNIPIGILHLHDCLRIGAI